MTVLWTSHDAAAATGGRSTRPWQATGVSIDTRTLQPGDLFVALKDARDGHDFVAQALAKGAAAALVSRLPEGVAEDAPLLIVPDVLPALEALGRAARARTGARVAAVTGSVGKTSTKEMLRAILSGQGKTHAAEASYNNHWGVPLTLARMAPDTEFAILELGMNHAGEIAPLTRMARPHAVMITTIAPAHLEALGSLEAIAAEKASIVEGLLPDGTAVLPADAPAFAVLKDIAGKAGARIVTFGETPGTDWHLDRATVTDEATVVQAHHDGKPLLFKVMSPGRHFAANALGALALAQALGADPVMAALDIARWLPPSGRGTRERILLDPVEETHFDLIDDAFNANPASLAVALDILIAARPSDGQGALHHGRRIAVLGDMLELGADEIALHQAVARHPGLDAVAQIHCVGPRMKALWLALPRHQRGQWVETAAELAAHAKTLFDPGDIVLVKGSKGSKVSLVVEALRRLGQQVAQDRRGTE